MVLELQEGTGTRTGSSTRLLDSLVCSRALQPHEHGGGCQHPNLTTFITVPETSEVPPRSQREPTAHAPGMAVQGVCGRSVGISRAGMGAQERLARPHPGSPYPRSLRSSDGAPAAGAPLLTVLSPTGVHLSRLPLGPSAPQFPLPLRALCCSHGHRTAQGGLTDSRCPFSAGERCPDFEP